MNIRHEGQIRPAQETKGKENEVDELIYKTIIKMHSGIGDHFDDDKMKAKIRRAVEEKIALAEQMGAKPNIKGFVESAVNMEMRFVIFRQYQQWMEDQGIDRAKVIVEEKFQKPVRYSSKRYPEGKRRITPYTRIEYLMEEQMTVGSDVAPRDESDPQRKPGKIKMITGQGKIILEGQEGTKEPSVYKLAG
ncbi:hypothetical protein KKC88_03365 [Patescibacteria group bacterium]|nr:hypothetical protein [Patescibacteria group bacterium]MBU1673831.1 hypothetical protein [Patescibacteria group bacterium]MBU1963612.1 hypothetical protein [Patescibacteria group bacterium]